MGQPRWYRVRLIDEEVIDVLAETSDQAVAIATMEYSHPESAVGVMADEAGARVQVSTHSHITADILPPPILPGRGGE